MSNSESGREDNRTLTRVPGVSVGHWTDPDRTTGVTVVLFPEGARGGTAHFGAAATTRQTGVFEPTHASQTVNAVCLAGGSAFGLAAADGVMDYLAERGVGFDSGHGRVPIVPAAVIFDLRIARTRLTARAGYEAAVAASTAPLSEGRVGAGTGATVAKWGSGWTPGGLGSAACASGEWMVGALAVVNAVGSIRDPATGEWVAGSAPSPGPRATDGDWDRNTTLVVVATDAPLSGPQATLVARMAGAGIARTVDPAFTPFDGDVVFALSTGKGNVSGRGMVAEIGRVASELVATSIVRAVR